jgi:hypothetical protein
MTLLDGLVRLKASEPRIFGDPDGEFRGDRCKYMALQIIRTEALVNIMALLYC